MEIYILRHGEAEERGPSVSDHDRKLTQKGEKGLRRVLESARRAGVTPEVILTSPLRRAQETAKIAAMTLRCTRIVETAALAPDAAPDRIWKELGKMEGVERVLLAGHEPHLSSLAALLLEAAVVIDLKKGGLINITTEGKRSPPRGVLKWLVIPKLVRRAESEPGA